MHILAEPDAERIATETDNANSKLPDIDVKKVIHSIWNPTRGFRIIRSCFTQSLLVLFSLSQDFDLARVGYQER